MPQIIRFFLFIVLLCSNAMTFAQRNRIKVLGIEYDNILGGYNSEDYTNDGYNRYSFCVGYERSFGSRVTLSLSYFIYIAFNDERFYFDNINVTSKIPAVQAYATGNYQEQSKHKILY